MIYRIRKEFTWILLLLIIGLIFYNLTVIREEQEWQRAQEIEMHYETIIKLDQLQKEVNELDKQIDEFIQKWNISSFKATAYTLACGNGDGYTATMTVPDKSNDKIFSFKLMKWQDYEWVEGIVRGRNKAI